MRVTPALVLTLLATACGSGIPVADDSPSPSVSPAPSPTASRDPDSPPPAFAAVRGNQLVLVATADGGVRHVVHQVGEHELIAATHLAEDGTVWFAVTRDDAGGRILRAYGGQVEEVAPGCGFAVSPDGKRLAYAGDARECYRALGVLDLATGAGKHWESQGDAMGEDPAWTWDGAAVVFTRSLPESGGELVRIDPATTGSPWAAPVLGPPKGLPDGTGWYEATAIGTGRLAAAQECCALDANSYDGGRYLLTLTETGQVSAREQVTTSVGTLDADPTGRHLLLTDRQGAVFHRDPAGRLRLLATNLRAATW